MTSQASAIFRGIVTHKRFRPRVHKLRYRVFSILFDLDELPALDRSLALFSRNRFNLMSFHDRDHGGGGEEPLRAYVERTLREGGITGGGPIRLLCMPRILGYVFNPLSVYFCYRPDGELAALLYEVNNTFGERHNYLIAVDRPGETVVMQGSPKRFHVSPFLPVDMEYHFRVTQPAEAVSVAVHVHDGDGLIVAAALSARRTELTNGALFRTFLMYPLLTLKVVAGIHWEALRLWLKGVRVHSKPVPPDRTVTIGSGRS
jgi:DUF1365 family protein